MAPYSADNFGDYSQSQLEIKPRLDLWTSSTSFDNTAWSFPPTKRRVRFSHESVEVLHISLDEYTYDEVEASWYRPADYQRFRKSRELECQGMLGLPRVSDSLSFLEEDEGRLCTTGLETPQEYMECRLRIRDAVAAVLNEQHYQRCYNSYYYEENLDFLAIAARYGQEVLHCKQLARLRGEQQAFDVHGFQPICCGA